MKTQSVLFAQIAKVDETQRLVYGRAAQEVVDRSGEIFDYATSKEHFGEWSKTTKDATGGQSVGNLRAMHGKVAAGKLTDITFNDDELAIDIVAKVVDDAEWNKVLEGVYTGFSIGGEYARKWDDPAGKGKRYTAIPSEISLVDRPCGPTSTFFKLAKADGTEVDVEFKSVEEPPVEKGDFQVTGTDEDVANLSKFLNDNDLSVGHVVMSLGNLVKVIGTEGLSKTLVTEDLFQPLHKTMFADSVNKKYPLDTEDQIKVAYSFLHKDGIEDKYDADALTAMRSTVEAAWKAQIGTELGSEVEKLSGADTLAKGLYNVQDLIGILMAVESVTNSVAWEERVEGEPATISGKLTDCFNNLADIVLEMLNEEMSETPSGGVMALSQSATGLQKVLEKVGARNSKTDSEKIQAVHDHATSLGAKCASDPAQKLDTPSDEPLAKAIGEVGSLQKLVGDLTDRLTKLESQPAPAKAILRVMSKGDDVEEEVAKVAEVMSPTGEVNSVASLIKSAHQTGGQSLAKL